MTYRQLETPPATWLAKRAEAERELGVTFIKFNCIAPVVAAEVMAAMVSAPALYLPAVER